MREVFGLFLIMAFVAVLLLLAEWLHRIFRVIKTPRGPSSPALFEEFLESGEHRYSIRHLERYFLLAFVLFLSFILLLTRERSAVIEVYLEVNSLPLLISIILGVGVWWAFRKGVLR